MSLLKKLPEILEKSKREYEEMSAGAFTLWEVCPGEGEDKNWLARGDNLAFIKYLTDTAGLKGLFQTIYIDPPFFSQADYGAQIRIGDGEEKFLVRGKAYTDTWERGMAEYLHMLCLRLYAIRDLLKEEGTIWVHLDWHGVHYVKILMDEIFGEERFINEVIWTYKSGGTSKRHFARKHDTLLFYGKGKNYYFQPMKEKSYNRGLKPYRFKGVEEYRDETGWYTLVNQKDVWQLDMVGRTSGERTGYATQKPEALLFRILESCTRPGDLCGDFFCGSGTLAAAAGKLGRNWICCDQGNLAVSHTISRLIPQDGGFTIFQQEETLNGESHSSLGGDPCILLDAEITAIDEKLSFLNLKLTGFNPPSLMDHHAGKKDRERIEQLRGTDSLSMVENWSVDFQFDGKLHRGRVIQQVRGAKGEIIAGKAVGNHGRVSIRLRDSFGRDYQRVLEIEGGRLCLE